MQQALGMYDVESGKMIDLYPVDGRLLFKPAVVQGPSAVVISIPKAGTYLIAEILKDWGFVDAEVHLSDASFGDYRGLSAIEKRAAPVGLQRSLPLSSSAGLIGAGQFAVGHLTCGSHTKRALEPHKKIFVYRELRSVLVSYMRFISETGRDGAGGDLWPRLPPSPERLLAFMHVRGRYMLSEVIAPVTPWYSEEGVLKVSYETLMGDHGADQQLKAVREMADFMGVDIVPERTLQRCLGVVTKTYSGGRSTLENWTDVVEEAFVSLHGLALNANLGIR